MEHITYLSISSPKLTYANRTDQQSSDQTRRNISIPGNADKAPCVKRVAASHLHSPRLKLHRTLHLPQIPIPIPLQPSSSRPSNRSKIQEILSKAEAESGIRDRRQEIGGRGVGGNYRNTLNRLNGSNRLALQCWSSSSW